MKISIDIQLGEVKTFNDVIAVLQSTAGSISDCEGELWTGDFGGIYTSTDNRVGEWTVVK